MWKNTTCPLTNCSPGPYKPGSSPGSRAQFREGPSCFPLSWAVPRECWFPAQVLKLCAQRAPPSGLPGELHSTALALKAAALSPLSPFPGFYEKKNTQGSPFSCALRHTTTKCVRASQLKTCDSWQTPHQVCSLLQVPLSPPNKQVYTATKERGGGEEVGNNESESARNYM